MGMGPFITFWWPRSYEVAMKFDQNNLEHLKHDPPWQCFFNPGMEKHQKRQQPEFKVFSGSILIQKSLRITKKQLLGKIGRQRLR